MRMDAKGPATYSFIPNRAGSCRNIDHLDDFEEWSSRLRRWKTTVSLRSDSHVLCISIYLSLLVFANMNRCSG
ncbi:hypothetical protein BDV26DRAFT_273847 [Aspergillus bertholletiae]|uniref:Uncharacterized protein n=1 Tax=Aspergillus bertholletiae TaxID=1226010 RepID=A0A5N7AUQ7_9EURO|nr:hypothetical protein BDV26DRAFT_273847 [Aspergillus bertholletiae]